MAKRRPKNNNVKNSRKSNSAPVESTDLASSINRLIQVLEAKGGGGFGNKEEKESTAASKSKKLLNKLGLGSINNLAETFLNKKDVSKFHNKLGEKLFGKGALGKGAKGLASLGGGLMRFAGPIGLIAGLGKMVFDFWQSGGAAKALATAKMMAGNKMLGAKGIADMRDSLKNTKEFRTLDNEYIYKKPLELKQQYQKEVFDMTKQFAVEQLQYEQGLEKDKVDYEIGLMKDRLVFNQQQAMQTLDAENEKRSALQQAGLKFITKYQTISERALKAVGSSTQEIVAIMAKFQSVFGKGIPAMTIITQQAVTLSKQLGGSVDDVLNMTKLFKIGANISAEMASNLMGGLGTHALDNGLVIGALFGQISNAAEEIAKFGDMNYNNLVREAGILTKMSVSYKEMLGATDSMVLNYKDSIKSEMSLSAMLGRNVNLSEVRARLMSNDTVGAANALKSSLGGMDINAMNAFQRQALAQATGMSTTALMSLLQGGGGNMTGALTANQEAGKQIATKMYETEVANAGAKLGLEQEQRKKLLEFEQRQRLVMLMVEQQQRLAGIKLEAAWRNKWTMEFELNQIKDLKGAEALVASASSDFFAMSNRNVVDGMRTAGLNLPDKQADLLVNNLTKMQNTGKINAGSKDFLDFTKTIIGQGAGALPKALQTLSDKSGASEILQKEQKRLFDIARHVTTSGDLMSDFAKQNPVSNEELDQAKQMYLQARTFTTATAASLRTGQVNTETKYFRKKDFNDIYNQQIKNLAFGDTSLSTTVSALTTSISSTLPAINKTMITTIPTGLEKTTVEVTKGNTAAKDDSLEVKSLLQSILNADSNGYVQLLRQGEVTNELLGVVIEATINGKSVTMDGMRVTKALQKVKDKQYGLGGKVSTYTDLPNAGARIAVV
jgi:hypothetical protein